MKSKKILIGFIGQGFIGKNYANDFENRGFEVIRYAEEEYYSNNKNLIKRCDIVFIAVPTPTTPKGFDDHTVREVVRLVGKGKIAVIKSTIIPGTTKSIHRSNKDIFVMHSPEFLTEATAAYDAEHPDRNIIGIPLNNKNYIKKAKLVLSVLPSAPYNKICSATEAELIKYGGNCLFFCKVIYINLLYDLVKKYNCDYEVVREAMSNDPRIGGVHLDPVHKGGRGAGGHCFIKDFSSFRMVYEKDVKDHLGVKILKSLEEKNIELLIKSGKDLDLLKTVYGKKLFRNKYK